MIKQIVSNYNLVFDSWHPSMKTFCLNDVPFLSYCCVANTATLPLCRFNVNPLYHFKRFRNVDTYRSIYHIV